MLTLNIQNVLKKKVGLVHGIYESKLKSFCNKNQSHVQTLFRLKSEPGYAFLELPEANGVLEKVKSFVSEQNKNKWANIVVLGIGGSSLGAIAVRDALIPVFNKGPKLYVVDNIDPAYISELLKNLNLVKTLFIVISKSGATTEPMVQYALVKEMLVKKFPKNYQNHLIFVTDPKGGLLRKIAKEEKIVTFDIPPKIGGRFSVLTNVGLLPTALAGVNVSELMRGAQEMRNVIKNEKGINNPALLLACIQYLMDKKKGKPMTVLMPYSNSLFRVGDWYRQLLAESIGKNSKSGPTPINALGTTDQHSQLQLYNEGPNNKLIIFVNILEHAGDLKIGNVLPKEIGFLNHKKLSTVIDAAYRGTAESLAKHKRPNLTIELDKVDAKNLGALFMLFESQVALLGLMYNVNAFNQPGVELSKTITKNLLKT